MTPEIKQRMIEVRDELAKRFSSRGLTVAPLTQYDQLSIERRNILISEKTKGDYRPVGTGQLYLKFEDERYNTVMHHAKKGVFDYEKIVSEFLAVIERRKALDESRQRQAEFERRIDEFRKENAMPYSISFDATQRQLTVSCGDEATMYRIALLLKAALEDK